MWGACWDSNLKISQVEAFRRLGREHWFISKDDRIDQQQFSPETNCLLVLVLAESNGIGIKYIYTYVHVYIYIISYHIISYHIISYQAMFVLFPFDCLVIVWGHLRVCPKMRCTPNPPGVYIMISFMFLLNVAFFLVHFCIYPIPTHNSCQVTYFWLLYHNTCAC